MYWLKRRVHPTWHFTVMCGGVVAGVVLAARFGGFVHGAWLGLAVVAGCFALYKQWRIFLALSMLAGLLVGLWRGGLVRADLSRYYPAYGHHVRLSGRVAADSELGKFGQTVLKIDALVDQDGHGLPGTLRMTTADKRLIKRGDRVVMDGKLSEGFGTFAATMNDATLVSAKRVGGGDPALVVRDSFAEAIKRSISEPAASLGIGYLLGQKQALPPHLQEALVVTGLTHIVVASGYNLTILVRLARRLFARLSKYLAALSGVAMVVAFVAMTGLSPSMTRAGLVSLLGIWAWYYGRKFHPVTLLLLAASVTVLWNPSYAWGDVGWLLSFAAFAGVMIVAPLMRAYFYGDQKPSIVGQILGETVAAQLMTAPIILFVFGQFSVVAVLSNLLVVPFIPLAMLLTALAGFGGLLSPSTAAIVGWPAHALLDAMIWTVNWTADVPWAQATGAISTGGIIIWYGAIVTLCIGIWQKTRYRLREVSVVE